MRAIDVVIEIIRKEAKARAFTKVLKKLNPAQLLAMRRAKRFYRKAPSSVKAVAPAQKGPTKGIAVEDLREAQERTNRLLNTQNVKEVKKVLKDSKETNKALAPAVAPEAALTEPVLKPIELPAAKTPVKWTDKMKQWYDTDPLKTIALTGGGVYAGQKLLDSLFDKRSDADFKLHAYAKKFIGR